MGGGNGGMHDLLWVGGILKGSLWRGGRQGRSGIGDRRKASEMVAVREHTHFGPS
jgi:hypothetical protein